VDGKIPKDESIDARMNVDFWIRMHVRIGKGHIHYFI